MSNVKINEETRGVYIIAPTPFTEKQMGFGLAVRKDILRRRGIIACSATRHPGPSLTARDHQELDELMARLDRKLHARR